MSATISKTSMSPDFLTKFLEEYREMPVLWQVRSADYSNRTKRDEAWDLLVQLTREKILEADLCFVNTFTAIVDLSRFNNSCLKSRQRRPYSI